jgi:hypothetical protein
MKTLTKLQIHTEKILRNEELLRLHGGEATMCCCWYGSFIQLGSLLWDNDCCHCACDFAWEWIYGRDNVGGYEC